MAQPKLQSQFAQPLVLRYGLAVLSVATALGVSFLLERYHFRDAEFPSLMEVVCGLRPTLSGAQVFISVCPTKSKAAARRLKRTCAL